MREINKIVIHCADTPPSMDIGADTIHKWHVHENNWSDIGYHYIIRRNGKVEMGRPVEQPGAHARGHNKDSIGVVMIGGRGSKGADSNFTSKQWKTLESLVKALRNDFSGSEVVGHRDLDGSKECPCFDAKEWASTL